jgi:hypothetical protein
MRLLLKVGARQVIDGVKVPLALALVARQGSTALELSRGSYLNDRIGKGRETILKLACEAKLFTVARYLFERGPAESSDDQGTAGYSIALFRILKATACEGAFVKRELLEDAFEITTMLLHFDADPDMCIPPDSPHNLCLSGIWHP